MKIDVSAPGGKKVTLNGKQTFRFDQGGSNGNGTFHVTGPYGLNYGPWNPRRTTHNTIRLKYSGIPGRQGKWIVSHF